MATAEDFFPSNYLKAADLGGKEITATIDRVESDSFENDGRRQVKPVVHFQEKGIKPLVSNKTNFLMIAAACGKDTGSWPGKRVVLYADLVPFKGTVTEAVRVKRAPAKAEFNDEITI
jgi:hypothetical protein